MSDGYPAKKIMRMRNERDLSKSDLEKIFSEAEKKFFEIHKSVNYYNLDQDGWSDAFGTCIYTNISAPDSIHLATAMRAGCHLLVTSDKYFRKNADKYLPSCLPEKFEDRLKEIGFKI